MAWEVDQEQAELKQGKWLQFSVALIYELTCANLSLFGNLNKKKKVKDLWKKWFFGSWTILCLLIVSR